jgi:ribosome-associated protein
MAQKKTGKRTVGNAAGLESAISAARVSDSMKATEIEVLDMTGIFDLADFFVLATCQSERQLKAVAAEIENILTERGLKKLGVEGWDRGGWLLLDFDEVIVHLFTETARDYYQLENLWGDAEKVNWQE